MQVRNILNAKGRDVFTVVAAMGIPELARELVRRRNGAAVVLGDDGALVGVISERDLIYSIAESGAQCLERTVADLMTREVITCTPDTSVDEVMNDMTERRIRHLPVIEDGALAGIISIGDVVKHRIEVVEREANQLREYITA